MVLGHEGTGVVEQVGGAFFGQSSFATHAIVSDTGAAVKAVLTMPWPRVTR